MYFQKGFVSRSGSDVYQFALNCHKATAAKLRATWHAVLQVAYGGKVPHGACPAGTLKTMILMWAKPLLHAVQVWLLLVQCATVNLR